MTATLPPTGPPPATSPSTTPPVLPDAEATGSAPPGTRAPFAGTVRPWHRPLLVLTAASLILTVVTAVGIVADPRIITGAPAFGKPFKFAISFVVYAFSLAWLLAVLPRRSRVAERAATVVVGVAVVELAIIVLQAARGTTSHFNSRTPFDAALFDAMGASVMVLFGAHLAIAIVALRQRIGDRPLAYAIKAGLLLCLLGMLAAVPMVVMRDTGIDGVSGAHSVGVPDGGPGLPLTGWSTTGGDLRIGHFLGLHALQALPLLAFLLSRGERFRLFRGVRRNLTGGSRHDEKTRTRLIVVASLAYGMLVVLTTWQALRGQPLLRPDVLTAAAWTGLLLATGIATTVVLRRSRS